MKTKTVKTKFIKSTKIFLVFVIAIILIHIIHALTLDRIIEYAEVPFHSARWPAELNGYRIAFISDVHVKTDEALEVVVSNINDRSIDLLLLGGDFNRRDGHYRRSIAVLSRVEAADGIFGVSGNHDVPRQLFAAKEDYGMTSLSNEGLHIHDGFFLAGLDDLRWGSCIETAIYGANNDDFLLLFTHNPDASMKQDTSGIDLIIAGHTHGGQITFFGIWAPLFSFYTAITEYGQRFVSGWSSSRDGVPVFVSNGTGGHRNVPRIFARPQVIIFTMYSL